MKGQVEDVRVPLLAIRTSGQTSSGYKVGGIERTYGLSSVTLWVFNVLNLYAIVVNFVQNLKYGSLCWH